MHHMDSRLSIRLPADLSRALERAIRMSGRNASEVVRVALRDYLSAPPASRIGAADRVGGLLGSLDSGLPDLAEQHRKYIIESLVRGE
jgi:metal-responsive CopG/Arc/MetJ family transcriptional regulator